MGYEFDLKYVKLFFIKGHSSKTCSPTMSNLSDNMSQSLRKNSIV